MGKIIVLGIGNQLMMDDGVGIYLVQELIKRDRSSTIQYLIGESDIDYCLEQMDGASFIIIVDAVFSGKKPGELSVYPLADLHEHQPLNLSPHNLHLFHTLYHQKDEIKGFLLGIEPFEINFYIGLSQPLKDKWDGVLDEVTKVIGELIALECQL